MSHYAVINNPGKNSGTAERAGEELEGSEGNGTPLQYSCLENPMDRGAWWATIHGVAKSRTRLSGVCVCGCVCVGVGCGGVCVWCVCGCGCVCVCVGVCVLVSKQIT